MHIYLLIFGWLASWLAGLSVRSSFMLIGLSTLSSLSSLSSEIHYELSPSLPLVLSSSCLRMMGVSMGQLVIRTALYYYS